jgi:hypothetical protein
MPFARLAPGLSAEQLVAALGDPHRSSEALWRLIALGPDAAGPARDGLGHPDPRVRVNCCKVLDHVMGQDDLAAVIGALADPEPEVRWNALHALACTDPSPAVRKKASWYAPGGPIFRRTQPGQAPRKPAAAGRTRPR